VSTKKIILITGATSGFGAAAARKYVESGNRVIISGRRKDRLDTLTAELGAQNCHVIHADIRDQQAMADAIAALPFAFKDIDVLINNAGIGAGIALAQDVALKAWNDTLDTNVRGLLGVTHAVLPGMLKRNKGHILNIGSTAAHYPQATGNVYAGTKAFLHQFSLSLRCDLLGTNLRVSCLEPGFCESDFTATRLGDKVAGNAYYEGLDAPTSEEIAEIMYWLTSLPTHINVNVLEVMPTRQALAGYALSRKDEISVNTGAAISQN
jgi:NADP-dependent 3-hydroxy acid dehydrogenase YdfG